MGAPADKESQAIEIAEVLARIGIPCLRVRDEDRDTIISEVAAIPSESGMIASSRGDLLTPMRLAERMFWLTDKVLFSGKLTHDQLFALLDLKTAYEKKHGYDLLQGKDSITIAGEEVYRMLGDFFTIRGSRMLDIGFDKNELLVHVRIRSSQAPSGAAMAKECLREMGIIRSEIA